MDGEESSVERLLNARAASDEKSRQQDATLTVLFADVLGVPSYSDRLRHADSTVVQGAHDIVSKAVTEFQGRVARAIGESVIAEFPDPVLAASAAVEVQRRWMRLNEWTAQPERRQLRIGVCSGPGFRQGKDLYGDAVAMAARITKWSGPAQVLISRSVREAILAGVPDFEPHCNWLGRVSIDANSASEDVYEVLWRNVVPEPHMASTDVATARRVDKPTPKFASPPTRAVAERYEVFGELGRGGMGVVYKARDRETGELVALKLLRSEMASDLALMERFKNELRLARRITHKNVCRIHEFNRSGTTAYISMEYVQGENLRAILNRFGNLSVRKALRIAQQLCDGLQEAHAQGIAHRDLKPENIMIDGDGNVKIMDFGIARLIKGGETTHAIVGTPAYMAPEQTEGKGVDHRTDIYALGLIVFEMLAGTHPFGPDISFSVAVRQVTQAPPRIKTLEPSVPDHIEAAILRCLAKDPAKRFQSIQELRQCLELDMAFPTERPGMASWRQLVRKHLRFRALPVRFAGAAAAVLLAGVLVYFVKIKPPPAPPVPPQPVQVLIADFSTPDASLAGSLEPVLGVALEGAGFIQTFDRGRARRVAKELRPDAIVLDASLARMVGAREGIDVIITGSVVRVGAGRRISAEAIHAVTGDVLVRAESQVPRQEKILAAVSDLAASIRTALGDSNPQEHKLSDTETFSAKSADALRSYAQAQELASAGKWTEAITYYTRATDSDPDLGRAYAGLAAAHANLGYREEADKLYKRALALADGMTEREKLRTWGGYYLFIRNEEKSFEAWNTLVQRYPADTAGQHNLALAYFYRRDLPRAIFHQREFLKIYPQNTTAINNVALFAMYAGDFETAKLEARKVVEMNPEFVKAHLVLAISELAQGQPERALEIYRSMRNLNGLGQSLAAAGVSDTAMYQGDLATAQLALENGIAADVSNKDRAAAANKLVTLAAVYFRRGRRADALSAAERALAGNQEPSILFRAGRIFVQADKRPAATELVSKLSQRLEREAQAYTNLLEGELMMDRPRDALKKFQEARQFADTWLGRLNMGRAYLELQAFTEAISEFEVCLSRRGEASAVFLDDTPTYHLLPPVYYYLGLARDGLKSPSADSYRTFLSMREKDTDDPMVVDARQRLNAR